MKSKFVQFRKGALALPLLLVLTMAQNASALCGHNICDRSFTIDGFNTAGDIAAAGVCTEITGNLKVEFTDLADLSGLECLEKLGGNLYIGFNDAPFKNVLGLNNLEEIGGNLVVEFNQGLENLLGLYSLKEIAGKLDVSFNSVALQDLQGMENLKLIWR